MAAKGKGAENTDVAVPKKSKKKIIIIIILLLFLGAGGAASFWFFQLRQPTEAPAASANGGNGTNGAATVPAEPGSMDAPRMLTPSDQPRPLAIVPLPTVSVNLADAAGDRFLKIGMEVEVSTPEAATDIQVQMPRIRDSLIILLSSKGYAELATAEGKMLLKNEIADRLNKILGVPRVVRIYFTEFVVQ